jgi:hypothetical protein
MKTLFRARRTGPGRMPNARGVVSIQTIQPAAGAARTGNARSADRLVKGPAISRLCGMPAEGGHSMFREADGMIEQPPNRAAPSVGSRDSVLVAWLAVGVAVWSMIAIQPAVASGCKPNCLHPAQRATLNSPSASQKNRRPLVPSRMPTQKSSTPFFEKPSR